MVSCCCDGDSLSEEIQRHIVPRNVKRKANAAQPPLNSYCDNRVLNSKYTLLSFVPINLWEQLHRPINLYFLIVGLVQFISIVSPVSPFSMLVPLGVGFGITAVKEGYDDWLRHKEDARDNARTYRRIIHRSSVHDSDAVLPDNKGNESILVSVRSKDLRVGDLVALKDGDEVPCDMIALLSCHLHDDVDDSYSTAFVSTENLDGESDAKLKQCALGSVFKPMSKQPSTLEPDSYSRQISFFGSSESPSTIAFGKRANSVIEYLAGAEESIFQTADVTCDIPSKKLDSFHGTINFLDRVGLMKQLVVDESFLLVGGSKVRSTAAVFGLVVFTGKETKAALSKKKVQIKWSQFDRLTTLFCIAVFIFQLVVVLACAITAVVLTGPRKSTYWYLGYTFPLQRDAPNHHGTPHSVANDKSNSGWEYYVIVLPVRMFILLTVLIPVSFKVMVEVSKSFISRCIEWDIGMCHTRNSRNGPQSEKNVVAPVAKNSSLAEDLGQIAYVMSDKTGTLTRNEMLLRHLEVIVPTNQNLRCVFSLEPKCDLAHGVNERPLSQLSHLAAGPTEALAEALACSKDSKNNQFEHEAAKRLLEVLVLCNVVERPPPGQEAHALPASISDMTYPGWESPSPDEAALVFGAHLCGASLIDRSKSSAIVKDVATGQEAAYNLVAILPFSSERGKMSVLVRLLGEGNESDYLLLTKGSDEKVLQCADPETVRPTIHSYLSEYSMRGLRTLVLAWKPVSAADAEGWLTKHSVATSISDASQRKEAIAGCHAELEQDLRVVGLSAVEDRLQDGVPETITMLRQAGIKVWMLTGDKVETAKQIGLSCQMLRPTDHLLDMTYFSKKGDTATKARGEVIAKLELLRRQMHSLGIGEQTDIMRSLSSARELDTIVDKSSPTYSSFLEPTPSVIPTIYSSIMKFLHISPNSLAVLKELWDPQAVVKGYVDGELARRAHCDTTSSQGSSSPTSLHYGASHHESESGRESDLFSVHEQPNAELRLSILINGGAISVFQEEPDLLLAFSPLLLSAVTVLCCRVAPDQKAFVVSLAKKEGNITLAIGDGGNDVAMIQEAHVGVGITGYEGRQAALAADFSLGQFRFLARLLLVHGHMAYQRSAFIVQYSFYKCVFIAVIQVLFNCYTLMSGVTFWSSLALTIYNGVVTIPMTFTYVLGTPALPRKHLLSAPYLYSVSQKGRYMNGMTFFMTFVRGLIHSLAVFYLGKKLLLDSNAIMEEGRVLDADDAYVPFYFSILMVQVVVIICQSYSMTWLHWLCACPLYVVGSFIVTWLLYSEIASTEKSAVMFLLSHLDVNLYILFIILNTVTVFYAIHNAFVSRYFPSLLQLFRQVAVKEDAAKREAERKARVIADSSGWLQNIEDEHDAAAVEPFLRQSTVPTGILAFEQGCEDPLQGNDFHSLVRSFQPKLW